MTRIAPALFYFVLAFLAFPTVFALTARPALAQNPAYYRAEFVRPAPAVQMVERDLLWSCEGQTCSAAQSNSRDAIICSTLARRLGALRSFSAGGKTFDDRQLANCNRRAS